MVEEIQNIPLDQIDAPKVAMRSDVHDTEIEELAHSIKTIGLLQPVILRREGERYEIIAGHRRVTAARLAGLVTISSVVRTPSDSEAVVMKLHENLLRRDVNPIDEAIFLSKFMQQQDLDRKEVAKLTHRSFDYINARLEILEYPDYLIEAIGEKQISLGAAEYLAKITDERVRANYVSYAISGGISVKRAIAWYDSWNRGGTHSNPLDIKEANPEIGEEREVYKELCIICQTHDVPDGMMLYYAHLDCVSKIQA